MGEKIGVMNRKGQETASGTSIVGWVLLAILLVIVVLAIAGFFNPILDKLNLLPGGGLSGLVTACNGYSQVSTRTDYCMFRQVKVNGETQYSNCANPDVQKDMDTTNQGKFSCDVGAEKTECAVLLKQGVKNPIVAGARGRVVCVSEGITCQDLGGVESTSKSCPPKDSLGNIYPADVDKTKSITVYNGVVADQGKVCCVAPLA